MTTIMGFQFRRPAPLKLLLEAGYTALFAAILLLCLSLVGVNPHTVLMSNGFQGAVVGVGAAHLAASTGLMELNGIKGKVAFIFLLAGLTLIIMVF